MALRDGSGTEFYKDTLFGLEGELKGWDKWVDGDKTGISSVRGYH